MAEPTTAVHYQAKVPIVSEIEALRGDLLPFAIGVLLATVGLAGLAIGLAWHGSRAMLLNFGAFSGLYGLRLAASTEPARFLIDAPESFWSWLIAGVTYTIMVPANLFFAELLGGVRWGRFFRGVALAWGVFAAVAIVVGLVSSPRAAAGVSGVLVVANQIVGIWAVMRPGGSVGRALRVVRASLLVFVLFVLNENAKHFGIPSVPDVEWIGFTLLLVGLGYATAISLFEGERRLAAVTQELETARGIQSAILPRNLPRIPGVSLAARYAPMSSVAGDFYDVVATEAGLGVFVADVSGHGVPAALVASMVKVAFAAQAPHADDPGRVLAAVNRTLCDTLDGTYVTAAYAWLDLGSSRLTYAAAGHPPLLIRGTNGVETMGENGLMMGVMPEARYPATSRQLARGDRIVFYTDGVIEAFSPRGELFDLDRLIAVLAGLRDTPDRSADDILGRLATWRGGGSPTDDVTLVVVDVDA